MSNPLVSIIVPYYDFSDYLLEAVNSAASQDYCEIEIIVVDDCSPVKAAEEILRAHPFEKLKIIRHEKNFGCATARNTAIRAASGDFILPLDSDDSLSPSFVSKTLPILQNEEEIACVYTQVRMFGNLNLLWIPEVTLLNVLTAQPGPPTFLYRKKVWESVDGYRDGLYHADAAFWTSLLLKGWKIHRIEEPLFNYRRHSRNGSDERLLDEVTSLSQEFREFFIENLEEILATEEKKYWKLKGEYKVLHEGFAQLEEGYTRLHKELDDLIEARSRSLPDKVARYIRRLIGDEKKENKSLRQRDEIRPV